MNPIWRPRIARQDRSDWRVRSTPARSIRLAWTAAPTPARPTSERAVTLLPEPDSPTMARHRPDRVVNDRPLTTSARPNDTRRFSTVSTGAPAAAPPSVWAAAATSVIGRLLPVGVARYGPAT